jgi:hypothetical protein
MGRYWARWNHHTAAPRVEERVALDLAELKARNAAVDPIYRDEPDRLTKSWRWRGERRAASLVVDRAGITINYHRCDDVGRCGSVIATERAPFHQLPARFGGTRRLLGCPGCGRRCRALHYGADRLRCRVCLGLRYRSQNTQPADRAMDQAAKIAKRLDPVEGHLLAIEDFPLKPPRMRWSTYWRLEKRHGKQRDRWTIEFMKVLGARRW